MKVVAILPAKGTSERIQSKNTKLLDGKPLFLYMLEKLCRCDFIDEVYLDTDSDEMLQYAPYLGYIPLKRDPSLADNSTDGHQLFMNAVNQVNADIYIQIFCPSPFIKAETIKKGVDILMNSQEYDSAVLVRKDKLYLWQDGRPAYDMNHIPNSKDLPDTISETMSLYITKREAAIKTNKRIGCSPYLLEGEPLETLDINYPADFELAEKVCKGIRSEETQRLNSMAVFLNSCLISDVLTTHNIDSVITGMRLNLPGKKVFGRANTLRIRKLQKGEDFIGAYDIYKTYKKIRPGEIIAVENELPDKAYFGELNANLSIRAGAIGTIVGGVTRDAEAVNRLGYPVFADGYCCSDINMRATFDYHNQPIHIKGVEICPGDLIFGDMDGIVVIPHAIEEIVLKEAIQSAQRELKVLMGICANDDAYSIYENVGAF